MINTPFSISSFSFYFSFNSICLSSLLYLYHSVILLVNFRRSRKCLYFHFDSFLIFSIFSQLKKKNQKRFLVFHFHFHFLFNSFISLHFFFFSSSLLISLFLLFLLLHFIFVSTYTYTSILILILTLILTLILILSIICFASFHNLVSEIDVRTKKFQIR